MSRHFDFSSDPRSPSASHFGTSFGYAIACFSIFVVVIVLVIVVVTLVVVYQQAVLAQADIN